MIARLSGTKYKSYLGIDKWWLIIVYLPTNIVIIDMGFNTISWYSSNILLFKKRRNAETFGKLQKNISVSIFGNWIWNVILYKVPYTPQIFGMYVLSYFWCAYLLRFCFKIFFCIHVQIELKMICCTYKVHTTLNQQSHDLFIISDEHMLHIHAIHILYYLLSV